MIPEELKQVDNEAEVRNFAKINGYDIGGTDALVAAWLEYKTGASVGITDIDDEH